MKCWHSGYVLWNINSAFSFFRNLYLITKICFIKCKRWAQRVLLFWLMRCYTWEVWEKHISYFHKLWYFQHCNVRFKLMNRLSHIYSHRWCLYFLKPGCALRRYCNSACPEQQRKGLLLLLQIYPMLQEFLMSNYLNVSAMSSMCPELRK